MTNNTIFCNRHGGEGFWQIRTIGVYADDTDLSSYAAPISVIDSGTTLFYLNPSLYNQIKNKYLSSCFFFNQITDCACSIQDSLPTLKFLFNGVEVSIFPKDYFVPFSSNGQRCLVQFN